jgi:hypothetical protein
MAITCHRLYKLHSTFYCLAERESDRNKISTFFCETEHYTDKIDDVQNPSSLNFRIVELLSTHDGI